MDSQLAVPRGRNVFLQTFCKYPVSRPCRHLAVLHIHKIHQVHIDKPHTHLISSRPSGKPPIEFVKDILLHPSTALQPNLSNATMLTILFTCNMIGSLFARSLHYQFYSWTAWTMPFLLWQTGWHPVFQVSVFLVEEWAWNVFPSTKASSLAVFGIYELVLVGVWMHWGQEEPAEADENKEENDADDKILLRKVD